MAHKSRLAAFVIDCKAEDLSEATRFWSAALGHEVKPVAGDGKYATVANPEGEPRLLLQAVEHDSRIHLDIETDDQEAEVARLEKLGARRIADIKRWVVMEAPTGHRFCVVNPQRSDFNQNAKART
jgi:predicted enzyme related to lactoylglutathione lyase